MPPAQQNSRIPWYAQKEDLIAPIFAELLDEDKDSLIIRCEKIVDEIVGVGHTPYYHNLYSDDEEWQEQFTTFPRDIDIQENETTGDYEPYIPYGINKATILLCELILEIEQNQNTEVEDVLLYQNFNEIALGDSRIRKSAGSQDQGNLSLIEIIGKTTKGQQIFSYLSEFQLNMSNYD